MQGFNVADYQDDENEQTSHQDISKLTHTDKHIIITGWSEKDGNSLNDIFSNAFSFCGTYQFRDSQCGFYCLDLRLSAGDDDDISSPIDVILINLLRPLLKCCLKCFNNYINVALAYNSIESDKISYYYQTRVTGNELEHQIGIISAELGKPEPQNINNAHFYNGISNQYLSPGIELVSGIRIGNSDPDSVLEYLIDSIKKTISFFDLPYSVLSNSSHLYHHPKISFPLPILLKSRKDVEDVELWKGIDWEDDDYKDCLDDLRKFKKSIVLGYYTREDEDGCEGPHIVLCPENIEAAASESNLKNNKELLYLMVLIHELAHAMMDKNNVTLNSLFSNAMEESLANMITLQWFDVFDGNNKESVKDFIMENQPKIYKFGINQFNAGVDWTKWRDSYKNMHDLLKDWFNSCFENPKLANPNDVHDAYNRVFDNDESQNGNTGLIF